MTIAIDIAVEAAPWSAVAGLESLVRRSVDAAAAEAEIDGSEEAELSVLFCDDAAIRTLNRDWRGKDKATNVLSFPAAETGPPGAPRLLGDIAIAYETVAREASEERKPLGAHLAHLVVHGFLHLGRRHGAEHEAYHRRVLQRKDERRLQQPRVVKPGSPIVTPGSSRGGRPATHLRRPCFKLRVS